MRKKVAIFLAVLLFGLQSCFQVQTQSNNTQENANCTSDTIEQGIIPQNYCATDYKSILNYLINNKKLPPNALTKTEAKNRGWQPGSDLWKVAPNCFIGGDKFRNYEKLLPAGKNYIEVDVDYFGGKRGAHRIVYSADFYIYYTANHYNSFELVYKP